jgi:hypothetical protein
MKVVALQFPGPDLKIAMTLYIRDDVVLPQQHLRSKQ